MSSAFILLVAGHFALYKNNKLNIGDIIVFNKNNYIIVHRIVSIKNVNNEIRYFTKGDANKEIDKGYITNSQIKGIVKINIPIIGKPTLWFRNLFVGGTNEK